MERELIGATIEIINANNPTLIGKKGKVIDETKNTIMIQNTKKQIILKNAVTFKVNQEKIINGKTITKRSYERIM